MKEKSNLPMSTGQLFVLTFTMGISLKMMMLPVLLLKASGRSAAVSLQYLIHISERTRQIRITYSGY